MSASVFAVTATGSPGSGAPRRTNLYDRAGALLTAALLGWAWIAALVNDTTAWPLTLLVIAVAGTFLAARLHPKALGPLAGALVLFLFGVALLQPAVASGGPKAPPLGYGNANGALFGLGVGAAALLAVRAAQPWRTLWWSATIGMLLLTTATTSRAATALALVVAVVAWCAGRWAPAMRRWCLLAVPALLAVAVAVTIAWASGGPAPDSERAEAALSSRRLHLWAEAVDLVRAEPWFGVGPGRFEVESPTAQGSSDTNQTHSEYLQVAAETGVPGAALLAGLAWWTFGALRRSAQDARSVVIVGAATAALAAQGAIDYVWHFPALMIGAAALLGAACASRATPEMSQHATSSTTGASWRSG